MDICKKAKEFSVDFIFGNCHFNEEIFSKLDLESIYNQINTTKNLDIKIDEDNEITIISHYSLPNYELIEFLDKLKTQTERMIIDITEDKQEESACSPTV
jgi:hypothetical protein